MNCQNRPENGQCPDNRNNSTVHNTIGDLFLCHACKEYCWPTVTATADGVAVSTRQRSSQKLAAAKASKNNKPTKASTNTDAIVAADADIKVSVAKGTSLDQCMANDERDQCSVCLDMTHVNLLNCDICNLSCHGLCAGLPDDVVSKLLPIVQFTGWVCFDCRRNSSQKFHKLQIALSHVTKQLSEVVSAVKFLQHKLVNVDTDRSHGRDKGSGEGSNVAKGAATDIAVEVHRTLADASKRK